MKRIEWELAPGMDFSGRQEELYRLLERQVRFYTMGDAESVPLETAQALLCSIRFCIETHLLVSGKAIREHPLLPLFEGGQRDVWRLTEEGKALLRKAAKSDPGYGNLAYRDTLEALEGFFRAYDLRFFAHDIPCPIDYPLCLPLPEMLAGIRYIGGYLDRLILENRFCGCFSRSDALRLFAARIPLYRALVINLFEPVFACALGLSLRNRDAAPLFLDAGDCAQIYRLFRPWKAERAAGLLRQAVNRLCIRFRLWDTDMRDYLMRAADNLIPLLRNTSETGYRNLFLAQCAHRRNG